MEKITFAEVPINMIAFKHLLLNFHVVVRAVGGFMIADIATVIYKPKRYLRRTFVCD